MEPVCVVIELVNIVIEMALSWKSVIESLQKYCGRNVSLAMRLLYTLEAICFRYCWWFSSSLLKCLCACRGIDIEKPSADHLQVNN